MCTAWTFPNVNRQKDEGIDVLFFLVVYLCTKSLDASHTANCVQLSRGVKGLIGLTPVSALPQSVTQSLVFRFESIRGELLCVCSPGCLHEKPRNSRLLERRSHNDAVFFKSEALRALGTIFSLGLGPESLEVSLGSVSRCRFVEDCGRSWKLCTVLLSNLSSAFVIALHFIMSCAKPWSGSAAKCLWYSFSRT